MSLVISLGSNLGVREKNLLDAKNELIKKFDLISISRIYESDAVDYTNQPAFLNQVLEFKVPDQSPQDLIKITLEIEKKLGRKREIDKGPRTVDIDILFWGNKSSNDPAIIIPHPRWNEREFIKKPLTEIPFFKELKNIYGDFSKENFETVKLFRR